MADLGLSHQSQIDSARQELLLLKESVDRSNLKALLKDKEIIKLKAELADLEAQYGRNKAAYQKGNVDGALYHCILNEEFSLLRQQLEETFRKLQQAEQEHLFHESSKEAAAGKLVSQQLKYLEKENASLKDDTSETRLEALRTEIDLQGGYIREMEMKLLQNRELVLHLESEVSELQDTISALQIKIAETETQCEAQRKANAARH
eukprot:CAMPEP_0204913514 /NCGR_PEP_ID=MMETSP1397-20131031/11348_1 /ASSEMBLY_ACC=CAM_ASM_000891 /TAXON_ID=49980 /ORGANISM="Climacostomum Climacostomum virens, Strain Stock W-24" /LENGTH=205 /DNA_ID=CAMNT_0052084755 /DNA_START=419 /DNA_END=1036 /DNA_ORIENTATION=+